MKPATVAIAGRPNVGKSTLLNRLIGRREAIVEARPGVTRDRKEVELSWSDRTLVLVDTGGWTRTGSALDRKVSEQAERAIAAADVVLVVVDATVGVTDDDEAIAEVVRRSGRPAVVVANKCDDLVHDVDAWQFSRFGLADPVPVSALHGRNTGDLLDEIVVRLGDAGMVAHPDPTEPDEADSMPSVVVVGRPNVGKSTLFNRIAGDERSVVHDLPGTTRDSIDTVVETPDGPVRFIDTAGMRRRSRVDEATEHYSTVRALAAVDRADVALLVVDATDGVTHQDQRLAERVDAAGCPIVVLLNKWEMLDADGRTEVMRRRDQQLRFLEYAPTLKISAATGLGVQKLLPALSTAIDQYRRRIPTAELNRSLRDAQARQPAPGGGRVLYATQGATDPPTITLFTNRRLPPTYIRYLERSLREQFGLNATALKLRVRRRSA